ncbi:MAG TPA: PHP domain-containing protein, partial [Spirochaetia bacterium]|nr:PHP domain-containing protein [Spirochaetia bacterium]
MINLHTHTYRCKHAVGDVPDYLTCAEAAGITTLGFSDHTPYPDGRWKDLRMDYSELDDYARVLSEASQLSRG